MSPATNKAHVEANMLMNLCKLWKKKKKMSEC